MEKFKKHIGKIKSAHNEVSSGIGAWVRRHKISTITTSIIVLLLAVVVVFIMVFYHDKAAPGTMIANAKVSGQTKGQIEATANSLIKNLKLSLTYNGKSVTASADDLGVKIDTAKLADEAVRTGQANPLSILLARKHFDLTASYDKQKTQNFVTTNFPELTTAPKDAQLVYDQDTRKFIVQPGAVGKSVKTDELFSEIEKLLAEPKIANYEIKAVDAAPTVDNDEATRVAEKANAQLALSIKIVNNGKVIWTMDPWDIAAWMSFSANPSTKTYDISYDKSKIRDFINSSVAGQLSNKPVNQKAITNANGDVLKVVSEGKNGQAVENASSVADQVESAIKNNEDKDINLTTKDSPFKTDATVAKDGHWIEANLSDFSVTLFDGTNAVWQTNQTSQGKPGNATITGLYTVWRKTYNQCMPNPPSTEPLCNIHYVTYWERSGYAFHEAWWMTYANGNVRARISHGCINMFQADAKRVYDWSSIGTPVWVHY